MTTITAERSTQALTDVHDLIKAIAGVQALIQTDVESPSPWCPLGTREDLGKAYNRLVYLLDKAVNRHFY
jgi:hypothetical protein